MRKMILWTLVTAVLALAPACGGGAEIGEACEEAGITDGECTDGAICGKATDSNETLTCLKICSAAAECAGTEDCNGVEGSNIKACRIK
jgi:hypothetical protein